MSIFTNNQPKRWTLLLIWAGCQLAFAQSQELVLPRDTGRTIKISDFENRTYLTAGVAQPTGIYAKTRLDDESAITVATPDVIEAAIETFDPQLKSRTVVLFSNGAAGAHAVFTAVSGKSYTPETMRSGVSGELKDLADEGKRNIATSVLSDLALLASGSGTVVLLSKGSYFYNVGYSTPVVKSGRSFAISPTRALLDPSDIYYLTELDRTLIGSPDDVHRFYISLLNILLDCNPSLISSISPDAQATITDFFAVYTAELDRHIMVDLNPSTDPWEIDIAEVTFLQAYGSQSGMVIKNGAFIRGTARDYYASGNSGGGIGETRKAFTKLGQYISAFEAQAGHHSEMINKIIALTPISDQNLAATLQGDIFRRFLVYINTKGIQSDISRHPQDYIDAVAAFLIQIREDQALITDYIKKL
jgi:hypothetical protein